MENQITNPQQGAAYNTKTIAGVLLLGLGALLLLKGFSFLWVISWPVAMIGFGLYLGIKSSFRKLNSIVLMAVGFAFLLPNIIPSLSYAMLWPLPIIAMGLFMVLRRNQYWDGTGWKKVN